MKNEKIILNQENAITLIALIITIIVLLILAGVTINLTLGDNGIFKVAEQATRNYKEAEEKELELLKQFNSELNEITDFENNQQYDKKLGVNKPKLLEGMTAIVFNEKNGEYEAGEIKEGQTWYNYDNKQWANAKTQDGSMWVWIPRYAYRINSNNTCEIVFLVETTDNYYEGEELKTAKRAKSASDVVDTTTEFTVHPAFTDESSINYANGGWDEELTGIWVAKFEAGYAGTQGNPTSAKDSTVEYTQASRWAYDTEVGEDNGWIPAANYYGTYGQYNSTTGAYGWIEGVSRTIKYPTFQGLRPSMNYMNINDMYNISRALTATGNVYGLKGNNADSHLMKNSEWGAVAYLAKSSYGVGNDKVYVNNANLNSNEKANAKTIYAVTGCCGISDSAPAVETTLAKLNSRTETDMYVWCQENGTKASTTGTVYGVYDMSGGLWEYTAGYVANSNTNLKEYGASVAYSGDTLKTVSTKYTTVYPHDSGKDNITLEWTTANLEAADKANYALNTKIYGDAVRETSIAGLGVTSWDGDYSYFWGLHSLFSLRGGYLWSEASAGVTAFHRHNGSSCFSDGFRAVLVAL